MKANSIFDKLEPRSCLAQNGHKVHHYEVRLELVGVEIPRAHIVSYLEKDNH